MAIKPVTQTALVDVNSASITLTSAPSFTEHGRRSKKAPSKITTANPVVIRRPGGWYFKNSTKCFIFLFPLSPLFCLFFLSVF